MEREIVDSTLIKSIGYDTTRSELEVELRSGLVYRYAGVPEFLYRGLALAGSKGTFFNTRIRDRYPFVLVE